MGARDVLPGIESGVLDQRDMIWVVTALRSWDVAGVWVQPPADDVNDRAELGANYSLPFHAKYRETATERSPIF